MPQCKKRKAFPTEPATTHLEENGEASVYVPKTEIPFPALELPIKSGGCSDTEEEPVLTTDDEVPEQYGKVRIRARKVRPPVVLADAVERDLALWYRAHPMLYNKGLREYKDIAKKTRLYEDKGRAMHPQLTGQQVRNFLETMRTRYGKLTAPKGGAPAQRPLTERDRWILEVFSFLQNHIVRQKNRSSGSTQDQHTAAEVTAGEGATSEGSAQATDGEVVGVPGPGPSPGPADKGTKRHPSQEGALDLASVLLQQVEQHVSGTRLPAAADSLTKTSPQSKAEESWRHFYGSLLYDCMGIEPALWSYMRVEVQMVIEKYKLMSKRRKTANKTDMDPLNDPLANPAMASLLRSYTEHQGPASPPSTPQNPPVQQQVQQTAMVNQSQPQYVPVGSVMYRQ